MPDTPHTLRPPRDEAEGYRPISGPAVAALAIAGLTAAVVLGIWVTAGIRKRPILVPAVLFTAAVALALAVFARWHVRRSEGTRTGLGLATFAFWVSLLTLGGYGAYFLATGLAVRQQARDVTDRFFALLSEGKPELAFRLTRPPAQQQSIEPNPEQIRARFGSTDFFIFETSDLVRTFRTWGPDKVRLRFVGERGRQDEPDGFQLELNYGLRTPEGETELAITTRGVDDAATGGRDWQLVFTRSGFRPERRVTRLGRLCMELQFECARRFMPVRWLGEYIRQPDEGVAAILRLEGAALPEAQRAKIVSEVRQPGAINLFPGGAPLRGSAMPALRFSPDGVWVTQIVEVTVPSLDKDAPKIPGVLTIRIENASLEKTLLDLAGGDWEQQPFLPNDPNAQPELEPFGLDKLFRVTELNLRPSQPRIAAGTPGPLGGQ